VTKNISLISKRTKKLKKKEMTSICKLKNSHWKWTLNNQIRWFKKKVEPFDINNMLFFKNKLVGYTLLRKRQAYQNKKYFYYYYFDSYLIHKNFYGQGLSNKLISFNNNIIKKLKKHSFLICSKKMIPYYKKFNWKILPKKYFKIADHKPVWFKSQSDIFGMTYMLKKNKHKIFYYFNKRKVKN
tara:strand:+ start:762 stop:1313 length:552 start_codon:yes stop_codon:yes gene_type:complete